MTSLGWDVFWRDHGAQRGLKNLGDQADRTHSKFAQFTRGLDRGLGSSLSGVTKGIGVMGGAALKFGGLAAAGLGVAGAAAVGFGVKVASGNEQARISFTTMLGSAKKADVFLRQLQKFAAETPFEFPELQTAASSLISAGINANKVIPIMKTLGNVTSGMGTGSEGVRRATIALQQMNAAGRITGEDLNQLRDAGIPVYDLLASATGKSKAEVVKLAQAGKLGSKELGLMMKALESGKGLERFAGLMDKQSKSLAGLWSTFKDTLGQGLAGIATQFFPLMKSGLEDISTGAGKVFGWFKRNKDSIAVVLNTGAESVKSFWRIAKPVLGAFVTSLTSGKGSFKDFAEFLSTHQADIVGGFVSFGKGAIGFGIVLAKMLSGGLRGFATLSDGLDHVAMAAIDTAGVMLHAVAMAFRWDPVMGPKLRAADATFALSAAHARSEMGETGDAIRGFAGNIDRDMLPALGAAGKKLDEVASKEIVKAQVRDAAKKAAIAIRDIGTTADGAQIKLKSWSDRTRLGAAAQNNLESRVKTARQAMLDQREASIRAGASQHLLTKRWELGKDALYREFIQMGLSKAEAQRLTEKYGKIPGKKNTHIHQPGMTGAKKNADELKGKYGAIPKSITTKINWDTAVDDINTKLTFKGGKGARLMSAGYLSGGYTGNMSPGSVAGVVHGDEQVTRSWARRRLESARPGGLDYMNETGRWPGYYDGGRVFQRVMSAGTSAVLDRGNAVVAGLLKQFSPELGGQGITGPVGAMTTFRGGRFTQLAAANLRRAEKIAGVTMRVMQGGWRPRTSYSGTSHAGDAVDTQASAALIRAIRAVGWASGDRTGLGNWGSHAHSVPSPTTGRAGGSAIGQYQDYLRRGGASQSLSSPWGLASGGLLTARVAEHGPERLLTAGQTRTFDRMVRVMSQNGGAVTYIVNMSLPNYVGSRQEMRAALMDIVRSGAFEVVKR